MRLSGLLLLVLLNTPTNAKRPWKNNVHLKHVMEHSTESDQQLAYELLTKGDIKAMLEYLSPNELAEAIVDYHTEVWPVMAPESADVAVLLKKHISWALTTDVNELARVMIRRPNQFAALTTRIAQIQKIAEEQFEYMPDEQRKGMPTPRAFMVQMVQSPMWILLMERIADYRERDVQGAQLKEEIRQKQLELAEQWRHVQEDSEADHPTREQKPAVRGKTHLATLESKIPLIQNRTSRFERAHVTAETLRDHYPQIFDKPDLVAFKVEIINFDTVEPEEMSKVFAGTHPRFPVTGAKVQQLRPLTDAEYDEMSDEDKAYYGGAEMYLIAKVATDSALEIVAQREDMSETASKEQMERNDALLKEVWYAQGMRTPEEVTDILIERSTKTEL